MRQWTCYDDDLRVPILTEATIVLLYNISKQKSKNNYNNNIILALDYVWGSLEFIFLRVDKIISFS